MTNEKRIMGIDCGNYNPLYIAFNFCDDQFLLNNNETIRGLKRINMRKDSVYQNNAFFNGGFDKNTRYKKTKIHILDEKLNKFIATTKERYVNFAIDHAIDYQCSVIQMENLKGLHVGRCLLLPGWRIYNMQKDIEKKAKVKDIEVVYVRHHFTSQRCHKCGYINKRKIYADHIDSVFKCAFCRYSTSSDYNAAKNIATENIDLLIDKAMKDQNLFLI